MAVLPIAQSIYDTQMKSIMWEHYENEKEPFT